MEEGNVVGRRWLTKQDLKKKTGWRSSTTINRKVREGKLPQPFYPEGEAGGARWVEADVDEYMRKLEEQTTP